MGGGGGAEHWVREGVGGGVDRRQGAATSSGSALQETKQWTARETTEASHLHPEQWTARETTEASHLYWFSTASGHAECQV